MNQSDRIELQRWVTVRWPNTERWPAERWRALWSDLEHVSRTVVKAALGRLQTEVAGALYPTHVVRACRDEMRARAEVVLTRPVPSRCRHARWGIVEESEGMRLGLCGECLDEKWFPAAGLRTPLEIEAR